MTMLVIGSRPPAFAAAAARLGVDYDVVYDPDERPREPRVAPRRVFWLPYMTEPEAVLALPGLDEYDGVVSFTDFGLLAAALATAELDLPGPPVSAVLRTRNKYRMRVKLRSLGFAQPAFGLVGCDRPDSSDFPLIVKPVDGTGSSGVRLVHDVAGLSTVRTDPRMMWESFVGGPQYTVEGIAREEGHEALAITGKILSGPPHFVVLEHETPAVLDNGLRENLTSYAAACLAALDVRNAATHTEIVFRGDEPLLIETHTRPAGDTVPLITRLTTGWDQCELGLSVASRTPLRARPHPGNGTRYARTVHLTPYDSNRVNLARPEWLRRFPEVISFDFGRVFSDRTSSHDSRWGHDPRWGHVVIAGPDRETLLATSRAIRARVASTPRSDDEGFPGPGPVP